MYFSLTGGLVSRQMKTTLLGKKDGGCLVSSLLKGTRQKPKADHAPLTFLKTVLHIFTWSIRKYFVPYKILLLLKLNFFEKTESYLSTSDWWLIDDFYDKL